MGDSKSILNQLCQKHKLKDPIYKCDQVGGEDHCPIFVCNVVVNGKKYIGKQASTKKDAEMSAAKRALKNKSFLPEDTTSRTGHTDLSPASSNGDTKRNATTTQKKVIDTTECILIDMENIHDGIEYTGKRMIHFTSKGHSLEAYADTIVESRYSDAVDVSIIMETTRLIDLKQTVIIVSKDKIFLPLLDLGQGKVKIITSMQELDKIIDKE